jgi:SNF2 family DNA or RNA helicase
MIRNTRSLVQIDLPPRYAQTILADPTETERQLQQELLTYLRSRAGRAGEAASPNGLADTPERGALPGKDEVDPPATIGPTPNGSGQLTGSELFAATDPETVPCISRMRLQAILHAIGSHPLAAAGALESLAKQDPEAGRLQALAASISFSAKDARLLELLRKSDGHKSLVFVSTIRTLHHLQMFLADRQIPYSTFSGEQNSVQKTEAIERLRDSVPVMLCTDSGGEGCNLQFADTLINYDLPWNPMRIEQRIGRVHRFGQTNDVFVFNLCTEGSIESRILQLLNDKIRMFELVVGEVGSILGNLEEGDEFESLVFKMWLRAGDDRQLAENFEALGESLLSAQEQYLEAKNLDDALFGEDFE